MRFFTALKLNKMKTCFRNGDYDRAIALADKISPTELRTAYDLSMMADIYVAAKRYGAARRVYAEMYKRNKSVRVCKQLIMLNIKLNSVKQAIFYLKELNALDNEDYERYVFQYQIGKILGQPDEYLIDCLKKVREADYIDKWALELAKLFYKTGRTKECIKECQNIKLWFPDTEYYHNADLLLGACRAGATYENTVERYRNEIAERQTVNKEHYYEDADYDENSYSDEEAEYYEEDYSDEEAEYYEDDYSDEDTEYNENAYYDDDKFDEDAEHDEFEEYDENVLEEDDNFDLYENKSDSSSDESIALLERSAEGKKYGSGTFDDRSYAMRKYDSASMTEISADDEAEISVTSSDVQTVADDFEEEVLFDLSDSVMTIMDEEAQKNVLEFEKEKEDIATTLINDSLTNEVINALLEQEIIGNIGDRDAVDESILKMLDEE